MKHLSAVDAEIRTMSSQEIADFTNKTHKNVKADIRRILIEAEIEGDMFLSTFKTVSGQNAT